MRRVLVLAIVNVGIVAAAAPGQEARPDGWKVLDRFVGEWHAEVTDKPSKLVPGGGKQSVKQSISRILKDRFILGREVTQDGMKALWFMTHDPKAKTYPFCYFNNKSVYGGEWQNTWDEAGKTFAGKATDTPQGWSSQGTNHFPDENTSQVAVWMKDESGTLLFHSAARKTRQPAQAKEKTLAAWSRQAPDENLPPELKVLERLVGTWDATGISRPAEWTPKELRTTSKVTRQWVLDGRFLEDTSEISDGTRSYSLLTYDPRMKAYRSWWLNSEGHTSKSAGTRDAAAETISFRTDLGNGLISHASVHFLGADRHVWKVVTRDGNDKLYFDADWTVTRRK